MQDLPLQPHPTEQRTLAITLGVRVEYRDNGDLCLVYALTGAVAGIALPAPAAAAFADGLWRHTCFEAFIAADRDALGYREFNFSPSGEWAVYDFLAYRERDPAFVVAAPPTIETIRHDDRLELRATLPTALLPASASPGPRLVGLCAVLESVDGGMSYRALHHAADRPDFHHRGSFTLELTDPHHHQEQP